MSFALDNKMSLDFYYHNLETVYAKQGDSSGRYVTITCTDHGKKVNLIPGEMRAYVRCKKPDGNNILNNAEITEEGTITFELTNQMLAVPGKCKVEIVIAIAPSIFLDQFNAISLDEVLAAGGSIISTMNFVLVVVASTVDEYDITSSSEYGALENALLEVQNLNEYITEMNEKISITEDEILAKCSETYTTKTEFEDATEAIEKKIDEASISITQDQIVSTVGDYYAKSDDFNQLGKKVAENESTITQTSEAIELCVKEEDIDGDYLISKINLDSTSATIAADKINLVGADITLSSDYLSEESIVELETIKSDVSSSKGQLAKWAYENDSTYINGENIYTGTITTLGNVTAGSFDLGNGNFTVNSDGFLSAKGGSFEGQVQATSGNIGGWTIEDDSLVSDNTDEYDDFYKISLDPGIISLDSSKEYMSIDMLWNTKVSGRGISGTYSYDSQYGEFSLGDNFLGLPALEMNAYTLDQSTGEKVWTGGVSHGVGASQYQSEESGNSLLISPDMISMNEDFELTPEYMVSPPIETSEVLTDNCYIKGDIEIDGNCIVNGLNLLEKIAELEAKIEALESGASSLSSAEGVGF